MYHNTQIRASRNSHRWILNFKNQAVLKTQSDVTNP